MVLSCSGGGRTDVLVKGGVVEVANNFLDGRDRPVPKEDLVLQCSLSYENLCYRCAVSLMDCHCHGGSWRTFLHFEVAADEELASHDGQLVGNVKEMVEFIEERNGKDEGECEEQDRLLNGRRKSSS